MSLARSLERRIEHLVEGIGSKVFRGQLHPVEVAIRIVREAELSLTQTGVGPVAPNVFTVSVNPSDLGDDPIEMVGRLNKIVSEAAGERGWRLEGPPAVSLLADRAVGGGSILLESDIRPGGLDAWAHLVDTQGGRRLAITKNRSLIGRSRRADVMLGDDSVSRTHALMWFDLGGTWVQDMASSNGTRINGAPINESALRDGDVVGFGTARFNFRRT